MNDSPFSNEAIEALPHQTPYFLFSKDQLVANVRGFKEKFPGSLMRYAIKANSDPEVLKVLVDEGVGFEAASKYELDILKRAGVPAKDIIYGTSVKSADHVRAFHEYGVEVFAADSLPELEKIAANAPGAKVYVRMSVNDTGSVFKFSEKFGTHVRNLVPLLERARDLGLVPYGISFHVGSQASNPMAWAEAIWDLQQPLAELSKLGITLEVINIGGGFPCRYASSEKAPELDVIAKNTLETFAKLPYQPKIMLEPGRAMVANAGVAVASVIARVERSGNTWLFLDMGVYNGLFETMAYQGSTRYPVTSLRPSYDAGESLFAVAGPTGDSPDIVTREALLPQDIGEGDKLIVHNCGAYSLSVTSEFNGFPKPPSYLI